MKQTIAATKSPSPKVKKKVAVVTQQKEPGPVFISLALDMSWRLLIAVLLPVIAGSELASYWHLPFVLYLGLGIGLLGAAGVMYASYRSASTIGLELAEQARAKKEKERKNK